MPPFEIVYGTDVVFPTLVGIPVSKVVARARNRTKSCSKNNKPNDLAATN